MSCRSLSLINPLTFSEINYGFYLNNENKLEKCPKNCKKCINSLKCTECNINYKLEISSLNNFICSSCKTSCKNCYFGSISEILDYEKIKTLDTQEKIDNYKVGKKEFCKECITNFALTLSLECNSCSNINSFCNSCIYAGQKHKLYNYDSIKSTIFALQSTEKIKWALNDNFKLRCISCSGSKKPSINLLTCVTCGINCAKCDYYSFNDSQIQNVTNDVITNFKFLTGNTNGIILKCIECNPQMAFHYDGIKCESCNNFLVNCISCHYKGINNTNLIKFTDFFFYTEQLKTNFSLNLLCAECALKLGYDEKNKKCINCNDFDSNCLDCVFSKNINKMVCIKCKKGIINFETGKCDFFNIDNNAIKECLNIAFYKSNENDVHKIFNGLFCSKCEARINSRTKSIGNLLKCEIINPRGCKISNYLTRINVVYIYYIYSNFFYSFLNNFNIEIKLKNIFDI